MSNSWSKEDRVHFEKSEVMKQLEKNLIDNYKRLEAIQNKIAAPSSADTAQLREFTAAANAAAEAQANLNDAFSASDDGQAESSGDEHNFPTEDFPYEYDKGDNHDGDYDHGDQNNNELADIEAVLEDLRKMVKIALDEKEYDLVYKIERTIDSLSDKEVICE